MCVVKPGDSAGQGHIVACCGSGNEGSLRVVFNGVDVIGAAVTVPLPFPNILNIWIVTSPHGQVIIVSAKSAARTFLISDGGSNFIALANPEGFDESACTFCCCDFGDATVQVTPKIAFLFYGKRGAWRPRFCRITSAENNGEFLVASLSNGGIARISDTTYYVPRN